MLALLIGLGVFIVLCFCASGLGKDRKWLERRWLLMNLLLALFVTGMLHVEMPDGKFVNYKVNPNFARQDEKAK